MDDVKLPRSPYKGLMPFSEDDAPFFFGRESERKIISANLRTRRLTLLYGPSGVGKSSVINAGVVYHLRQLAQHDQSITDKLSSAMPQARAGTNMDLPMQTLDAADELRDELHRLMVIVFSNWIGDPLASLKDAILAGLKESAPNIFKVEAEEGLRALRLTEMLQRVAASGEDVEILIILDQFEEYFVYHPVDQGVGKFDDEFSRALVNVDLHANFLLSIREDWLARLDRFKGRIPNLFENSIRIDHLDRKAAQAAIEKPIEKYNELIDQQGPGAEGKRAKVIIHHNFTVKALKQLVLLDGALEAGLSSSPAQSETKLSERRVQTSRLQLVLQYLWDKIKNDSRPTLGSELLSEPDTVRQIFQLHLEESLKHLTYHEKLLAANLFRLLITTSGTKFADTAEGLTARCGGRLDEVNVLLRKLSLPSERILNQVAPPPGQHNEPRYEITSDVLAAPIMDWVKEMRGKQRRKVARQLRYGVGFIIFLFAVIAVTVGGFMRARRQRHAANEQQRIVEQERAKAQRALDAVRKQDARVPYSKAVLRGHGGSITSAVFTEDGHILTSSADGSAILWDIESKEPVREFSQNQKNEKGLVCAAISAKGDFVVTASGDGTVRLWNLATTGSTVLREGVGIHVTDISFSPKGEFIAVANTKGAIFVWNTTSGDRVMNRPENGKAIRQISFSPSGNLLAAASDDHTVGIWRSGDWVQTNLLVGHTDEVNGLAFTPNEKFIATASRDTTVRVWDLSTSLAKRILWGHAQSVNSVDFDKDGRRLLSASDDTTARVWNVDTSKSIQLIGHTDKVLSASFSPNDQQVVTASKDNVARIWSANTGRSLVELRGHLDEVTYVSYSKDGRYILTASDDATARVWFASESGNFVIDQPTISATPANYRGPCPVTISFLVGVRAVSGSGNVVYRFRGSGGQVWPTRELPFDEPGQKFVNWYWRITGDYNGSETIEVIEPKDIKSKSVGFKVKCNKNESPSPEPSPPTAPP
jgi:WD40 repeat protein